MYSKYVRVCVYLPIRVAKQSQLADQNQNPASEKGMMTAECRGCCHSALQCCKLQSGCERWWHACPVPVWQFTSVACLQPPKLSARYFCKYLPLCGTYSFAPRQVKCVGFHGWWIKGALCDEFVCNCVYACVCEKFNLTGNACVLSYSPHVWGGSWLFTYYREISKHARDIRARSGVLVCVENIFSFLVFVFDWFFFFAVACLRTLTFLNL